MEGFMIIKTLGIWVGTFGGGCPRLLRALEMRGGSDF